MDNSASKTKSFIKVFNPLRAFAVFGVFIAHLNFFEGSELEIGYRMMSYARFGVDFFFVLSGFVLAMNYSQKFRKGFTRKEYLSFEFKRIKKIYPIYLMVIIYGVIRYAVTGKFVSVGEMSQKIIACAALLQSAVPLKGWATAFSGATWFLSCIFVLYLITPFLLKKLKKTDAKRNVIHTMILFVCFNVTYLCFHFMQYYLFPQWNLSLVYNSPYINIFPFLLGMLCYLFFETQTDRVRMVKKLNIAETIVGATTICWCLVSELIPIPTIITYNINMLVSFFLVFIFAYEEGEISKALKNRAMMHFGSISFEFYLIHYIIVTDIYYILSQRFIFSEIGMVIFAVAAFIVTYILSWTLHSLGKKNK